MGERDRAGLDGHAVTTEPQGLRARLATRRAQARRVLWFERIWPSLWPVFALAGAWIVLSLFDLPAMLPPVWHWVALVAWLLGLGGLLWRGLRPLTRPTDYEVDRRLERASGFRHRPVMVIDDRPASIDPAGAALWQVHMDRAAAQVARLRVGWPHPGIPQADVRATRAALAMMLVIGLVVAGPEVPARLARSFWPGVPTGPSAPAPQLQAWATPPSYTGLPPIFLHPESNAVTVPVGSHLTVSLTGGSGAPSLSYGEETAPFAALDAESWQGERDLARDGDLVIHRNGREQGRWAVTVIPDAPPTVAWATPPGAGQGTRRLQTRLPWSATDDYGVVSLQAELRLQARPSAAPLVITIPVPGGASKSAKGVATQDLVANPWAGLPVVATLVAKDAPGQRSTSAPATFIMPERVFKNPLARAVIDIRKRLSLDPESRAQASSDLGALADAPEAFDNNTGVFLALSSTATLLGRNGDPATIAEAQGRLWSLALQLEDDAVARTAQAVQAAREALKQAVQKGDKTDMDRKADALRREIQRHLQALAEQARRNGTLMPFDPSTRTLNQQDFERLTQEMKDAAKAGRMDEAQQKMEQLEKMLEQLKQAEANPSGDRQQARQQRQRGQQQMGAAEDMVQREGAMKGRAAERDAQSKGQQPGQDQAQGQGQNSGQPQTLGQMLGQAPGQSPGQQPGQGQAPGSGQGQAQGQTPGTAGQAGSGQAGSNQAGQAADARQQKALRRALGQMMQNFGDLTGKIPDALSQADIAMDQAGQALAAGKNADAAAAQQRAIDALQKGQQQMSQQMAQSLGISVQPGQGEGQGGGPGDQLSQDDGQGDDQGTSPGDREADGSSTGQPGDQPSDVPRDPLGRPTRDGTSGRADGGDVHVPDQMEQARTREIQSELRRREGERTRPAGELDYIGRLLKSY